MTANQRTLASSGSPFEATIGYSRAVRVGNQIFVSGTAPTEADGSSTPGGSEEQTARCLEVIIKAIETLGGSAKDIVRTRVFLVDPSDAEGASRAHGRVFGEIRPASSMIAGAVLLRPEWRVEVEADAIVLDA